MRIVRALGIVMALLFVPALAVADVPTLINYQGILTDAGGTPITTPTSVVFSIYQDPVGGVAGWTESQIVSPDAQGRITILLGSATPIPNTMFDWHERYLEVKVAADPPFPRIRFVSVAYAYHAKRADSASLSFSAAPGSVNAASIADGTIQFSDMAQNGASSGQVMKWNGSAWVAATDETGGGGDITGVTAGNGLKGGGLAGDVTLYIDSGWVNSFIDTSDVRYADSTYLAVRARYTDSAATVSDNAVTSAKIADATIQFGDIGQNSATSGQVLKWNGSTWAAANDDAGTGGGWTDDGTFVRLTDGTNKVGIGTTTPREQVEITGNLRLPMSTASAGVIKSGGWHFIHNYGSDNTFIGRDAGNLTMTGANNSANGSQSLSSNTSGAFNTANGALALYSNTSGHDNTACGYGALYSNIDGVNNTATGLDALRENIGGSANTAYGFRVLFFNTAGSNNTASGYQALYYNTTGSNTATGAYALRSNTTGQYNTASGVNALFNNTTGYWNTSIGAEADVSSGDLTNATAIGANAIVSASNSLVLGGTGANAVKVGIGTTAPAGALDVVSTTGAFIVPRMTTAQRDALAAVNGMIIYNTTTDQFNFREAGAWVTK